MDKGLSRAGYKIQLFTLVSTLLFAMVLTGSPSSYAQEPNRYFFDATQNTGHNNGYSEHKEIDKNDPHFGWSLGAFELAGFSGKKDETIPVFYKNAGDEITLSYVLQQDIKALNGNEDVQIAEDKDGYDKGLGIPETNFGKGFLIVRSTNHQNSPSEPQTYQNYLEGLVVGANTKIDLFEEGDYEVALDYEIESPSRVPLIKAKNDYQTRFQFKIRNSNSIVFLFDSENGKELFNGSSTDHGFRVDFAGSKFLNVRVKKEILNETEDGMVEDTRFNRIASDGTVFQDEGIYTITVRNDQNPEDTTTKRIYVGTNPVVKAAVANSTDIATIKNRISSGEKFDDQGKSIETESTKKDDSERKSANISSSIGSTLVVVLTVGLVLAIVLGAFARNLFWKRNQ